MRRLATALLLAFCCCAPAMALDWHVTLESGVNDESGIESRVDFRVQRWYVSARARTSEFFDATLAKTEELHPWACSGRCYSVDTTTLVWSPGTQWSAELHYRGFPQHGPVLRYVQTGELDATWFLGWRAEFGSQ